MDNTVPAWNLQGQSIQLHLDTTATTVAALLLNTTIKTIKENAAGQFLNNMPISKMQLKHPEHGFLKDAQSLAELNLPPSGVVLELSVKSRGGKR